MPWRGLLRVVDFQTLLTSQAILAEALAKAGMTHGQRSDEARALREGYNLIAKVLSTRRAAIPAVHDLAWLDHTVVSAGVRLGKSYEGKAITERWEGLSASPWEETVQPKLVPRAGTAEWTELTIDAFGGAGPLKVERGIAGPFRVGLLTQGELLHLSGERPDLRDRGERNSDSLVEDLDAFAATARRDGRPSVALVFAASSPGGDATE